MRMVFNFKMSLEDYHQMMVSRTFGNSWIRRIILLVAVSFPAAVITMEINVSKYKDAYLSGFKAERQIVADEEGLTFCNRSTGESGSNPWGEVTKLEELKDVFVIQLNRREAVILPKRGMGNTKKVDQFREMVKEKIPERFYPLKRSVFR